MRENITNAKASLTAISENYPHEMAEELELLDIYKALVKRKKIIAVTVVLSTLFGILYAFLRPDIYTYSTAIQIGALSVNGDERALGIAKSMVSETNELITPTVLNEYYLKHPSQEKNLTITASTPKESEIIVLSAKTSDQHIAAYKELLTSTGNRLMAVQNKKIGEYKAQLTTKITNAEKRLQTLTASEHEINQRIDNFQKLFQKLPVDNSGTTTLVITELFGQLQTVSREKYSLETQVVNLVADRESTSYSLSLLPLARSMEPVNGGKNVVIIASLIGGFILGVFIALVLNFFENVKDEMKISP